MSADLLDQLAAYGDQDRRTRSPIALDEVTGDVPAAAGTQREPLEAPPTRPDRRGPGSDRRRYVTVAAAAMVIAVIGLIAVLAAVRDDSADTSSSSSMFEGGTAATVELFRVNSDAAAYWRLTSLPEYDGDEFRLPRRSLERVDGVFPPMGNRGQQIRQQIQVLGLEGRLVPAAPELFQATGFSGGDEIVLDLDRDTGTLVSSRDLATGDLFTIVSTRSQPTPDELRASASEPPDPILVALPDDLPDDLTDATDDVLADAGTSYDAALALQKWLRDEFTYRADVTGHSRSDLQRFVGDREGGAEQFASTFAVLARSIGLPTRLAVGFTPGVLDQNGWYSVTDAQSHLWPEVWFDDFGWVAFEPTPGRGIPGAEQYTGVSPQQNDATLTSRP